MSDLAAFAFPVLIADIGGTNARFALVEAPDRRFLDLGQTETRAHAGPLEAVADFALPRAPVKPRSALFAVAAPIESDPIVFTNCAWVLDPGRLVAAFGLDHMVVLNDFEAQALALPALASGDEVAIGGGTTRPDATRLVVGPGTGLGVCQLVRDRGAWVPVRGEGGHMSYAPQGARETAIVAAIGGGVGRVTAEHLLSGAGLVRLHRAIRTLDGGVVEPIDAATVTAGALAGEPTAREAMEVFATALGRFAGDLALLSLPHGGVHVAGGIPPRILPFLTDGRFRAAFEDKEPYRAMMAGFATRVVTHPLPAFLGLSAFASRPQDYAVDLDGRLWRG